MRIPVSTILLGTLVSARIGTLASAQDLKFEVKVRHDKQKSDDKQGPHDNPDNGCYIQTLSINSQGVVEDFNSDCSKDDVFGVGGMISHDQYQEPKKQDKPNNVK